MNPFKLSIFNIDSAIFNRNYVITGLLETGEVTIAVVSDLEKQVLEKIVDSPSEKKEEIIEKLNELTDNKTNEIFEAYKQLSVNRTLDACSTLNICKKNGLRIKTQGTKKD